MRIVPVLVLAAAALPVTVGVAATPAADSTTPRLAQADRSAGDVFDDSMITAKVKSALIDDPVTRAIRIDVDTHGGTVELTGSVETAAARERATELVLAIEGVEDVENRLAIAPADNR